MTQAGDPSSPTFQVSTLYHIMEDRVQNWYAVLSILEHLLTYLKKHDSDLKEAYLGSDNAGCYHCAPLLRSLPGVSRRTGVYVRRYDFSESCDGKDICDRRNAPLKLHVLNYVHAGHDVLNATQLKGAIDSYGGIVGTQACVVTPSLEAKDSRKVTWPGIGQFNNFEFSG